MSYIKSSQQPIARALFWCVNQHLHTYCIAPYKTTYIPFEALLLEGVVENETRFCKEPGVFGRSLRFKTLRLRECASSKSNWDAEHDNGLTKSSSCKLPSAEPSASSFDESSLLSCSFLEKLRSIAWAALVRSAILKHVLVLQIFRDSIQFNSMSNSIQFYSGVCFVDTDNTLFFNK